MQNENIKKIKREIQSKAASDTAFKKRLIANPEACLKEFGVKIPQGVKIQVHENTPQAYHLVLESDVLSEDDLMRLSGGGQDSKQTSGKDGARGDTPV